MDKEVLFSDKARHGLTKSYKGLIFISENAWAPCIVASAIWEVGQLWTIEAEEEGENVSGKICKKKKKKKKKRKGDISDSKLRMKNW